VKISFLWKWFKDTSG